MYFRIFEFLPGPPGRRPAPGGVFALARSSCLAPGGAFVPAKFPDHEPGARPGIVSVPRPRRDFRPDTVFIPRHWRGLALLGLDPARARAKPGPTQDHGVPW